MSRTVPSQIDHYLSQNLEFKDAYNVAELEQHVGILAGFIALYRAIPSELINLPASEYASLVADMSTIELAIDRYRRGGTYSELTPVTRVLPSAWKLIKKLPDAFPTTQHALAFIKDTTLQEMIALDVDAIRIDLQNGEWKGATVLAGSCSEALLPYALLETETNSPGSVPTAVASLTWPRGAPNTSDLTDQSWNLFSYTVVAYKLKLITDTTKAELDTARDFRNLIHPAKAIRQKVTCDRGTAYVSSGAMDHVIRDLKNSL